ncbi:MAG TPA: FAD/NAD(P)-binding oxidoreductase [Sedimentisphaerales bacterium]|jgi:NADPH-dependent 2,4-dienoyl-CoA reductase/sulfur reductase-like enzyme|nr:FAD/NAD(P)-binding oxidoreductase [Sedimentisphaerales bacterium]HNU31500.1 FAD/NAD(P)-binding oxidoreductase [Sedimentisphaerales bacterium]
MTHYTYLIIGGGMAGDAAVQGIRDLDPQGSIGMIGEEKDPPYNRAPLSKGLWTGRESLEAVWRRTQERNVNLHLGRRAQKLDAQGRVVVDDHGEMYTFDKLLLATGGRPRRLPFGQDSIVYFRTLEDYRQLRAAAEQRRRFAVIGGGFIGSEIAAALATIGKEVTMIFPEIGIGGHMFPPELYRFLNNYYRQKGVQVLSGEFVSGAPQIVAGEFVSGLDRSGDEYVLHTSGGRQVVVDGIVAGIGIEPNTDLAQQANLTVEDGICVDECLRTSHPDIYAAGDVARFYSPALGRSLRVEHEDNANAMGRMAGRNMAGASEPYHCLPCFHSKLFDLGYEAVGLVDSRLQTAPDWEDPFHKGVVYYLKQHRVRGVLLWNVWERANAARDLVATMQQLHPESLKGRLVAATKGMRWSPTPRVCPQRPTASRARTYGF